MLWKIWFKLLNQINTFIIIIIIFQFNLENI